MRFGFSILSAVLGSATAAYDPDSFYPDWMNEQKCVDDGKAPQFMKLNPTSWTYATLAACCDKHFSWNKAECYGNAAQIPGYDETFYYPSWSGGDMCVNDGEADAFMKQNPDQWFFPTLDECCEKWYGYDLNACKTAFVDDDDIVNTLGTNEWYPDWLNGACVRDCEQNDLTESCGGLANSWDSMHATRTECCQARFGWNEDVCMQSPCGSDQRLFSVHFTTDDFPCDSKIRLYIDSVNSNNIIFESNNGLEFDFALYTYEKCIDVDETYIFRLYDYNGGDGLEDEGSFILKLDDEVIHTHQGNDNDDFDSRFVVFYVERNEHEVFGAYDDDDFWEY